MFVVECAFYEILCIFKVRTAVRPQYRHQQHGESICQHFRVAEPRPPLPDPCSFNSLGVKLSNPDDADSIEKLALVMFDTRTIRGLDFNPFSNNNVLKLNAVQEYPQDLYFILRTVLMFRGMAQARGSYFVFYVWSIKLLRCNSSGCWRMPYKYDATLHRSVKLTTAKQARKGSRMALLRSSFDDTTYRRAIAVCCRVMACSNLVYPPIESGG